jgi:MFS family permease
MITEPAVTLTDYAIAIECAVFVFALARLDAREMELRFWFIIFFASIGIASALGGTVHGFFLPPTSPGRAVLWPATMLSILVTSAAVWTIGAVLHLRKRRATLIRRFALAQLAIFSIVVLFVTSKFYVAILAYLPSTVFLLYALVATYRRRPNKPIRWGIIALALTLVGAAVQQLGIGIHPVYFNHNAVYHVIQIVAFWMIFVAAKSISIDQPTIRRIHDLET